jgi:hypothetical protein
MIAGSQLNFGQKFATKELYAAGGQVVLDGVVNQKATIYAKTFFLNGTLKGPTEVRADEVVIGANADISGGFVYYSPKEAVVESGAKIPTLEYHKTEVKDNREFFAGVVVMVLVTKVLFMMLLALVLYFIFKGGVKKSVEESMSRFGWELLTGLVLVIVLPIVGLFLFITLVGIPLAIFLFFVYMIMMMLGSVMAMYVGAGIIGKIFKVKGYLNVWTVIGGAVVVQLLVLIPVLGWLASAALFLVGFGTLFTALYRQVILKLR